MTNTRRCPKCEKTYPADQTNCDVDGMALVDLGEAAQGDPFLGQLIDSRYKVEKLLGIGGMGKVYLAEHVDTRRPYAIKLMHDDLLSDEDALQRFDREARALNSIDHPHVVDVYDYGRTQAGVPFLVMEFLQGTTLRDCLNTLPGMGLPLIQAVKIAMQAAEALRHVHENGIIHRDIKPDNIQLTVNSERSVFVKLFDFGIARIQSQSSVTAASHMPPATLAYGAPEIHTAANYLTPAIDVYALGISLFEMIAKERPFRGTGLEVVWAHMKDAPRKLSQFRTDIKIPPQMDELIEQLLLKDPAKRPTMAQVVDRLAMLSATIQTLSAHNLHSLRTFVLPSKDDKSSRKAPSAVAAPREPLTALEVLSAGRSIDQIETDREHLSAQMQEECERFIKRYFVQGVPPELARLIQRCAEIDEVKGNLELDLALLNDELSQERAESQAKRNKLRQEIQALRDELRAPRAINDSARQKIAQELGRLERAYASIEPASPMITRVQQEGTRQQLLRAEQLDAQWELGEQLLRVAMETDKRVRRQPSGRPDPKLSALMGWLNECLSQLTALNEMLQQA